MRKFSFRPAITMRGRKNKGLRGLAGKPFHPPLTDLPVAGYVFAGLFDVLSLLRDSAPLRAAATYVLVTGAVVSLGAVVTGWADWHRSSEVGTQARRTINAHAIVMIVTSLVVLADIAIRQGADGPATGAMATLSVLAGLLVSWGSTYGGSLVFDYGFNVETATDSPVWHESESDILPGDKASNEESKA